MKKTRSLTCVFVGHVDHGKTSLLDRIRASTVAKNEPGLITQQISAHLVNLKRIKELTKKLIKDDKIKIPGILIIDSPGHAAFTNLRKIGGSLADIAVLVIDINEGFRPQTIEALEILKNYKTPFVIAVNKLDLIPGWHNKEEILIKNINLQSDNVKTVLNNKIYGLVGKLYEYGFNSERFDKVEDYAKQIALIPVSAKTGEGIGELIMVLIGLSQKFLEKELEIDSEKPGKATILEIKKLNNTKVIEAILYDGKIKEGDLIVIGGIKESIQTKIRGLFELSENSFKRSQEVYAANAIQINASNLEEIYSGMPIMVANKNQEKIKEKIQEEVEHILIETEKEGVILKADSLGSLEALINLIKEREIKIKTASLGEITKEDIIKANSNKDEIDRVILGFNIKNLNSEVKIIVSNVIYDILEKFDKWKEFKIKEIEIKCTNKLTRPFKIKIMAGYIFRQSNPAVVGVEVLAGTLKTGITLLKDNGTALVEVKGLQDNGKNISQVEAGKQIAMSLQGVIVGRQLHEGEVLYSDISEENFRKLKEMKKLLNSQEIEVLKEIAEIKRRNNAMWGI